jgi:hypothetical protein
LSFLIYFSNTTAYPNNIILDLYLPYLLPYFKVRYENYGEFTNHTILTLQRPVFDMTTQHQRDCPAWQTRYNIERLKPLICFAIIPKNAKKMGVIPKFLQMAQSAWILRHHAANCQISKLSKFPVSGL